MSSSRTSLCSMHRLWPVFEEAEEPGIFSVPEPKGKLGIFPSPIAYIERDSPFRGGELKIFLLLMNFPHISYICLHIFHIFLYISHHLAELFYSNYNVHRKDRNDVATGKKRGKEPF